MTDAQTKTPWRFADCGATFDHDPHLYKTRDGKPRACDGSTNKK